MRFTAALREAEQVFGAGAELLPVRLARAARDTLEVAGAVVSLHDGADHIPLAASDDTAALAERLQFTIGSGPSLDVAETGRTIGAGSDVIPTRWSPFAAELFARTPYRSVVSAPVAIRNGWRINLDLFLAEEVPDALRVIDLSAVAEAVAATLLDQADPDSAEAWLDAPSARLRRDVWVVLGRLSIRGVPFADALDMLRARAASTDSDVDEVAHRLETGELSLDEFVPAS